MIISRRQLVSSALAMPAVIGSLGAARAATTLKISHQFPGGTIDQGDFRDRLVRIFAREVEKRTNGELKFEIYANSSLMKTNAQFAALRKGALDLSLYPVAYAGGELHPCNLGLMPCLVTDYEQGAAWKNAEIGKALASILSARGIQFLSWIWQAGGVASRGAPVVRPADAKGIKIRGGSREMDLVFAAAGGQVSTMPSNEIYIGMQTGALDAAVTSSTSLRSFRLEELAKSVTTARKGSFWFMLEPLLISKQIFDALPQAHRQAMLDVGAEMESWGTAEARHDDNDVVGIFEAKKATVTDMDAASLAEWRKIAEESAWKDFAAKSSEAAELLKLAKKV